MPQHFIYYSITCAQTSCTSVFSSEICLSANTRFLAHADQRYIRGPSNSAHDYWPGFLKKRRWSRWLIVLRRFKRHNCALYLNRMPISCTALSSVRRHWRHHKSGTAPEAAAQVTLDVCLVSSRCLCILFFNLKKKANSSCYWVFLFK